MVPLAIFLVRYRSRGRPREVEGPQVRGHTNLELAWTAAPVIILAVISAFVFWKVSDLGATSGLPASEANAAKEEVTIDGHQYYWEFIYPNGAISVDTLRLPLDKPVRLTIVSHDVAHSWWVPGARRQDRRDPGTTSTTCPSARPSSAPSRGNAPSSAACCTRRCARRSRCCLSTSTAHGCSTAPARPAGFELGKEMFTGVCAKCHGLAGQGDIGPNIASNPLLERPPGLANVIRNGTGQDARRRPRLVAEPARRDDRVPAAALPPGRVEWRLGLKPRAPPPR